jgi:hypothetical protein
MSFFRQIKKWVVKTDESDLPALESGGVSSKQKEETHKPLNFNHIVEQFGDCVDIFHKKFPHHGAELLFFNDLVDYQTLQQEILNWLQTLTKEELTDRISHLNVKEVCTNKEAVSAVLNGQALLSFNSCLYVVDVSGGEARSVQESETESILLGPHEAFVESSKVNIALIRRKIRSAHLKSIPISVGEISKTTVTLMYLEDIVNKELFMEIKQRLEQIEIHGILDTNMLVQLMEEHPYSPFPQFFTTERPDVVASKLLAGKIVGVVDESPYVLCTPSSFFDFMQSADDYNQRWITGAFIRLLRYFSLFITVTFTAFYVSVTTYHYEMIPQTLLPSLIESRNKVPFPPLIEALFLEFIIELLREAGARLPTKIGQTIGIVGGIVIGQAAVEAGITSNILIIAVAVSAIASFVIPSYSMSASIRIVRFSFILLAGFWGNIGLIFGLGVLVVHLTGLTVLKTPYFIPVSPTYFRDWLDVVIRAPYKLITQRPTQPKSQNKDINKMKN